MSTLKDFINYFFAPHKFYKFRVARSTFKKIDPDISHSFVWIPTRKSRAFAMSKALLFYNLPVTLMFVPGFITVTERIRETHIVTAFDERYFIGAPIFYLILSITVTSIFYLRTLNKYYLLFSDKYFHYILKSSLGTKSSILIKWEDIIAITKFSDGEDYVVSFFRYSGFSIITGPTKAKLSFRFPKKYYEKLIGNRLPNL